MRIASLVCMASVLSGCATGSTVDADSLKVDRINLLSSKIFASYDQTADCHASYIGNAFAIGPTHRDFEDEFTAATVFKRAHQKIAREQGRSDVSKQRLDGYVSNASRLMRGEIEQRYADCSEIYAIALFGSSIRQVNPRVVNDVLVFE